jgi:uncharacterized HhH-GPD family protein
MALHLTGDEEADRLLSDDPFALLVGMVLDQQIPLERAFLAPALLRERLGGTLDVAAIAAMDPETFVGHFSAKPALHRFPAAMAGRVQMLASVILKEFDGDATRVWSDAANGAELLRAIRSLPGFGEQKARIFIALLGKQMDVRPIGWERAAGNYATPGTFASIADIDSPEALDRVRAHKAQMKLAAKSTASLGRPGHRSRRPSPR